MDKAEARCCGHAFSSLIVILISNRLKVQKLFSFSVFSRVCTNSDLYFCTRWNISKLVKNIIERNFIYIILQLSLALLRWKLR